MGTGWSGAGNSPSQGCRSLCEDRKVEAVSTADPPNSGVTGTNPLVSGTFKCNFTVSPLCPWFCIHGFPQPLSCSTLVGIYWGGQGAGKQCIYLPLQFTSMQFKGHRYNKCVVYVAFDNWIESETSRSQKMQSGRHRSRRHFTSINMWTWLERRPQPLQGSYPQSRLESAFSTP